MWKQVMVAGLVGLGLVGCAATPKPELSRDKAGEFLGYWAVIHKCNEQGLMGPDVAAYGIRHLKSNMDMYSYDQERISRDLRAFISDPRSASKEVCNHLSMEVAKQKQQDDILRKNSEIDAAQNQRLLNNLRGTNTYCNKIGNQVFCNSY